MAVPALEVHLLTDFWVKLGRFGEIEKNPGIPTFEKVTIPAPLQQRAFALPAISL